MKTERDWWWEVLNILGDGEASGAEVKAILNAGRTFWRRWSGPAFYAMMARMEEAGLVTRSRKLRVIAGRDVVTHYFKKKTPDN